ncbi:MAG TPA: hypothetical protein VND90_04970 [Terracidiphilus sp.]|nr:hypothetical protein [Terracidiphilus sp.]
MISAILAVYGFATIRLASDWQGADFIAQHVDGKTFLKVQLKGALTFAKKYLGKDIYISFCDGEFWYLFPHDEILERVKKEEGIIEGTRSWQNGEYAFATVGRKIKKILEPYRLDMRGIFPS